MRLLRTWWAALCWRVACHYRDRVYGQWCPDEIHRIRAARDRWFERYDRAAKQLPSHYSSEPK